MLNWSTFLLVIDTINYEHYNIEHVFGSQEYVDCE